MSTVDKALSILDLFSEKQPNLGLSEMARLLGWDKSNVQRYVSDLSIRGILEQDTADKTYFLGPAISRLAMVRERTHPIPAQLHRILVRLVEQTGETAHASQWIGGQLRSTGIVETRIRGTRVFIDPAEKLPLHASASGIAYLSVLTPSTLKLILAKDREIFTDKTPLTNTDIHSRIEAVSEKGVALMEGTFESDVIGIAAPIVGFNREAYGAISVATPSSRFTIALQELVTQCVICAAQDISRCLGAVPGMR